MPRTPEWQSREFQAEDNPIVNLGLEKIGHEMAKFLNDSKIEPGSAMIACFSSTKIEKFDPPQEKKVIRGIVLYYK